MYYYLPRPPALHRFPKANAKRAQEMCQVLVARYDGTSMRSQAQERPARSGACDEEGSHHSGPDIVDDESLARVRSYEKQMKADAKGATSQGSPDR
jgi:hypothetical protein